jgi:hypothetical protein
MKQILTPYKTTYFLYLNPLHAVILSQMWDLEIFAMSSLYKVLYGIFFIKPKITRNKQINI